MCCRLCQRAINTSMHCVVTDVWWQCDGVRHAVEKLRLRNTFGYLQLIAFPAAAATTPPSSPPSTDATLMQGAQSGRVNAPLIAIEGDLVVVNNPSDGSDPQTEQRE